MPPSMKSNNSNNTTTTMTKAKTKTSSSTSSSTSPRKTKTSNAASSTTSRAGRKIKSKSKYQAGSKVECLEVLGEDGKFHPTNEPSRPLLAEEEEEDSSSSSSVSSTPISKLKKKKNKSNNSNNKPTQSNRKKQSNHKKSATTNTVKKASKKMIKSDGANNALVCRPANASAASASAASIPSHIKTIKTMFKKEPNDDDVEAACCCLCFAGVDCADRGLFFSKDRKDEIDYAKANEDDSDVGDYYFTLDDPYLPEQLYDKNNALVYCDSCNRLYHQKCHFVPLLVLPRGDWNCLICLSTAKEGLFPPPILPPKQKKKKSSKSKKKKSSSSQQQQKDDGKKSDNNNKDDTTSTSQIPELKRFVLEDDSKQLLYSTPPTIQAKELEKLWEIQTSTWKAILWYQQLKQLKQFLSSQASNIRLSSSTLETIRSTKKNRVGLGTTKSQELKQTLVKITTSKFKIREALISLESIRVRSNTTLHKGNLLQSWCNDYPQHAHHIYPLGYDMHSQHSRIIPRTREMILELEEEKSKSKKDDDGEVDDKKKKKPAAAAAAGKSKSGDDGPPVTEIRVLPSPQGTKTKRLLSPRSKKRLISMNSPPPACLPPVLNSSTTPSSDKAAANNVAKKRQDDDDDDDDDSGITLDDLQCCICMIGDASDDNDVILCDGIGCYRAYHMKCVYPFVKSQDIENEDDHWFCPLCYSIDNYVVQTQIMCCGEDWEHRRAEEEESDRPFPDDSSLKSWEVVDDVFPTSKWEMDNAERFNRGRQSEDIDILLASYLGEGFAPTTTSSATKMPVGSDSEDEEDYSLFDEASYQERRKKERQENKQSSASKKKKKKKAYGDDTEKATNHDNKDSSDDDDSDDDDDDAESDSSHSSAATLVDMSSVELEIGKDELAALTDDEDEDDSDENSNDSSGGSGDDDGDNNDETGGGGGQQQRLRVSRRLRNKERAAAGQRQQQSEHSSMSMLDDGIGADFSEANILEGKRRRKPIDYRKLNDALFGELSEKERAEIDDTTDYKVSSSKTKKKKKTTTKKKAAASATTKKKPAAAAKRGGENKTKKRPRQDDSDDDEEEKENPTRKRMKKSNLPKIDDEEEKEEEDEGKSSASEEGSKNDDDSNDEDGSRNDDDGDDDDSS